ncbi:MAG: sulfurtransferase TusA family protein [Methanothrix sp.]|nr:sulfurtransferase TusA family protein [Methanothrix sp.]
MSDIKPYVQLDCVGLFCPIPLARTKEEIENIDIGQILKVEADDPTAELDIPGWAKRAGHKFLKFERSGQIVTFWIEKMR